MKHIRMGAVMVAVAAALVSLPAVSTGAVASGAGYVLDLQLDEPAGSTVAVDSSGLEHHGEIGSHIKMTGSFADWDRHPPGEGIYYGADHLIVVPDAADASLDPGTGNFSVEFRMKTHDKFGNVLQKGQAATRGGQIKFQIPGGKLSCMFRSPTGIATTSSGAQLLNDDVWHTIRCDRTPTSVTMYVDGIRTGRINHDTGDINNDIPWTLGGKLNCDFASGATADSCDYFPGEIDYLRLIGPEATSGSTDTTAPLVTKVSPTVKAIAVPTGSNVTATFTESVTGVSGSTMTLRDPLGVAVDATVSYSSTKRTATLDPTVPLPANTRFTASLDSAITDLTGNPLPMVKWSFTTGS